jgi:dihydroorotase
MLDRSRLALLLFAAAALGRAQPAYDLVLKGGHVIDPKNGISVVRDVAIKDGRIAAVAARLDETAAAKTIDVSGLYVTPGLVDIHVHVFAGRASLVLMPAITACTPTGLPSATASLP